MIRGGHCATQVMMDKKLLKSVLSDLALLHSAPPPFAALHMPHATCITAKVDQHDRLRFLEAAAADGRPAAGLQCDRSEGEGGGGALLQAGEWGDCCRGVKGCRSGAAQA